MFDEAGGNWDAIEKIKKTLEQRVSCEFHFFSAVIGSRHTQTGAISRSTRLRS